MPFFLSDEFKTILEDKIRGTGGPSDKLGDTLGGTTSLNMTGQQQHQGGNNMYKSVFLKEKVLEQNEKRKRDRKTKKAPENQMPEHNLFGGGNPPAGKKGKKGANEDGMMLAEEAQDLIDDLKNDLSIRDQEYADLKAQFAKIEAENKQLREAFETERNQRLIIEGKLKKTAIHNELKENAQAITQSTFFE